LNIEQKCNGLTKLALSVLGDEFNVILIVTEKKETYMQSLLSSNIKDNNQIIEVMDKILSKAKDGIFNE